MVFQFEHICLQYQEGHLSGTTKKELNGEVERNLQQMADRVRC